MLMQGWVKFHRQLIEWEWYDDINVKVLFLHLILKANHKSKKYKGTTIKVGQVMTGYELLSREVGLSVQQIRTAINKLKSTNEITIKTSSKGTVIQVVKYLEYQVATNVATNEQQTNNKRVTTNKNVKKEKNVYRAFDHLELSVSDFDKLKTNYTKQQIDDCLDSIENYKKNTVYKSLYLTAKKWLKKESAIKQPQIFEL